MDLARTSSKPGFFILITNWNVTWRWPPRFRMIPCATIRIARSPLSRHCALARRYQSSATTTLRTRPGVLAGCGVFVKNRPTPRPTNTIVIDFEQLATNVRDPAVDVILLDTTFWGGIRACIRAAQICEAFGLSIAVHSSGELGIQLATMLHLGAVLPNLVFAADAHYHHLLDDVIAGGKMGYVNGSIPVPNGPGLGIALDHEKLGTYAELYRALGSYPYDRDPGRPQWYPLVPNTDFADPGDETAPDFRLR